MTFIAKVNDSGSFIAKVNDSASFDVTLVTQGSFNATMGVIGPEGPTGVLTADAPLNYDSVLKNLSIDLSAYATLAYVDGTFQTQAGMSAYYLASNPAGYITASALTPYATEAWVSNQGYITSSALTPYLLSSTAAFTYQPIGDYATSTDLTNGLALKADVVHTHDASAIVSGTIDLARIPIIPSQIQVVSTQNSIANLTPSEQAQITGAGVLVTTTDGNRWVYSGSGSKTSESSYVKVADITPDWTEISNKPAFGSMSLEATTAWLSKAGNLSGLSNVATARTNLGLGTMATQSASSYYLASNPSGYITSSALNGYATESWVLAKGYLTAPYNPFDQTLNTDSDAVFASVKAKIPIGAAFTEINSSGITFPDATIQTTAARNIQPPADISQYWMVSWHFDDYYPTSMTGAGVMLNDGTHKIDFLNDLGPKIRVTSSGVGTELLSSGIKFPDGTEQYTAAGGGGLNPPADQTKPWLLSWDTNALAWNETGNKNGILFEAAPHGIDFGLVGSTENPAMRWTSSGFSQWMEVNPTGLKFPDGTTQTTAAGGGGGIPAPFDTSKQWMVAWNVDGFYPTEVSNGGLLYDDSSHSIDFGLDAVGALRFSSNGRTNYLYVSGSGITFADGTFQNTAYTGSSNPFDQSLNTTDSPSFNDVNANSFSPYGINSNLNFVVYNDVGAGTTYTSYFDAYTGKLNVPYGVTSSDPLNGDQVNITPASIALQNYDGVTNRVLTINAETGITFSDGSTQTTAFPPTGGTTAQYIDGTGALQAFPTTTQTAENLETTVYNNSGSTISKHSVVYINGGHGNDPTIALARADDESTSRGTFGFTTADIPDQSLGTVLQVGKLTDVNTFGYTEGTLIFLSPTVSGGWTATQPYSPNHYVVLGTVTREHPTQGTIQVRIINSNELSELSDVQVSTASTGDVLSINSSGYWVPVAPTSLSGIAQSADIQVFGSPTESGSFTWTKPAGAKLIEIILWGGGGGGGAGARRPTTDARAGGGGGGGGSISMWRVSPLDLGETVIVTVGAGGGGAGGRTTDGGSGASGSNGGDSLFGNYRTAGGFSGTGGSTVGGTGGSSKIGYIYSLTSSTGIGGAGSVGSAPTAAAASSLPLAPRGGTGGAGQSANVVTNINGTAGGSITTAGVGVSGYTVTLAGGTGGNSTSPDGGSGSTSMLAIGGGSGGGSGAYRTASVGGNGGNGGWPSGGGGGGAASDNGFNSGAGGNGANGKVMVITYF